MGVSTNLFGLGDPSVVSTVDERTHTPICTPTESRHPSYFKQHGDLSIDYGDRIVSTESDEGDLSNWNPILVLSIIIPSIPSPASLQQTPTSTQPDSHFALTNPPASFSYHFGASGRTRPKQSVSVQQRQSQNTQSQASLSISHHPLSHPSTTVPECCIPKCTCR